MAEEKQRQGITGITVSGFKSFRDESHIEVRPLTILAGANSSGKSSIMQPLLMLKQTLEASFNVGPLRLDGPNVDFTSANQFMISNGIYQDLEIGLTIENHPPIKNVYRKPIEGQDIELLETRYNKVKFRKDLTRNEIKDRAYQFLSSYAQDLLSSSPAAIDWHIILDDCFYNPVFQAIRPDLSQEVLLPQAILPLYHFTNSIIETIHVPGLRGNPERSYPFARSSGPKFPGRFENYTASVLHQWQENKDGRIQALELALSHLNLTQRIAAKRLEDTRIEVRVGRTLGSSSEHVVNIADVGIGVSQVLPVLVALLVAQPEQLVYIEQPELHLHPRAQSALAQAFVDAANRGVRVVVETHSDLFLLGIQTLVAQGTLAPEKVKLHWFKRDDEGVTHISSTSLNKDGSFAESDWPEDFDIVRLNAQSRYLDAAELVEVEPNSGD